MVPAQAQGVGQSRGNIFRNSHFQRMPRKQMRIYSRSLTMRIIAIIIYSQHTICCAFFTSTSGVASFQISGESTPLHKVSTKSVENARTADSLISGYLIRCVHFRILLTPRFLPINEVVPPINLSYLLLPLDSQRE